MRLSGPKTTSGDVVSLINVENFSNLSIPEQANTFLEPLDAYRLQEPFACLLLEDKPEFLSVYIRLERHQPY